MTTTTRTGRRRRLLHDGASAPSATPGGEGTPGAKVRYTPPAESASFAVAARVLPRSPFALAGLVAGSMAVTAALGWADGLGAAFAQSDVNAAAARLFSVEQPGSLTAWWEAALWLVIAGQCLLLFGMRRHRTDDVGGGYRWWLLVAAVAVGMSLGSATHAHNVVAMRLASLTGFSPLAGDAFWWLAPGAVVTAVVATRSIMELRESHAATALAGIATAGVVAGGVVSAGMVPAVVVSMAPWLASPLLAPVAAVGVAVLVMLTLLTYSRRIVREAFGEVSPPAKKEKPAPKATVVEAANEAAAETPQSSDEQPVTKAEKRRAAKSTRQSEPLVEAYEYDEEPAPSPRRSKKAAKREVTGPVLAEQEESSKWVSGPEGFEEDYDDGPQRRKLSKSERKRLRREKERRAA